MAGIYYGGTSGNDPLVGTSDTDSLVGGGGQDTLTGDGGADTLLGGADNDSIFGGAGNDLIHGGGGADSISGGGDTDTIYGGGGNDTVDGGDGNDLITDDAPAELAGTVTNGTFNSNASGWGLINPSGTGPQYSVVDDAVYLNAGTTTNNGDGIFQTVNTTVGSQYTATFDTWASGTGTFGMQLQIVDASGTVLATVTQPVTGTTHVPVTVSYTATTTQTTIRIVNTTSTNSFASDAFVDNVSNTLIPAPAAGGNDSLSGGLGNDTIYAGAGTDALYGGDGTDSLFGGTGNDLLNGGAGIDTLTGGTGADTFVADGTADRITDFDTITGMGNNDPTDNDFVDLSQFYNLTNLAVWNAANPGNQFTNPLDWLQYEQSTGSLTQAGGLQIQTGGNPVNPLGLTNESTNVVDSDGYVDGSQAADVIDGAYIGDPDGDMVDANDAVLPGASGDDDYIRGFGGDDTISAGDGNDIVEGGDDDDEISGGTGDDSLYGDGPNYVIPGTPGSTTGNLVSNGTFNAGSQAGWTEGPYTSGVGTFTVAPVHGGLGFGNDPYFQDVYAYTSVTAPVGATTLNIDFDYQEWNGAQQLASLNTWMTFYLCTDPNFYSTTNIITPVTLVGTTNVTECCDPQ